jgi:hypothetical protein
MIELQDVPQTWWDIDCAYDGIPGSWALAAGDTARESEANFRRSLMYPELAVNVTVKQIGLCTAVQALAREVGACDA